MSLSKEEVFRMISDIMMGYISEHYGRQKKLLKLCVRICVNFIKKNEVNREPNSKAMRGVVSLAFSEH